MISDEAVEAAAKGSFESLPQGLPRTPWEALRESLKDEYRQHVRPILEAAAPRMLAEFDKRRKYDALAAIRELGSDDPNENPYRSPAVISDEDTELHLIIKTLRNTGDRRLMVCSSADRAQIVEAILAAGYRKQ